MGDGNNHRIKPATIVISIMGTLIAAWVVAVFGRSVVTGTSQTDHEASADAHPVIQNKVNDVADQVEVIDGKVDRMMLIQERQSVVLEQIGDDIGELKEADP